MNHTSATHADTKALPVAAVFTLSACCHGDFAVSRLAAGELDCVASVAKEKRLPTKPNIHTIIIITTTTTIVLLLLASRTGPRGLDF